MNAVRLRLANELRTRWRSWLAFSLLLGLVGGVVLTAAAGARRTDTAYPRFQRATAAADLLVAANGFGGRFGDEIRDLPGVTVFARLALPNVYLIGPSGQPDPNRPIAYAGVDGGLGTSVDRPKILQGRRPRPGQAGEVMVDPRLAHRLHLRPGSEFPLLGGPPDAQGNLDPSRSARMTFRVAAIVVFANQVVPVNRDDDQPEILLTPAFYDTVLRSAGAPADGAYIRLRRGTSLTAFRRGIEALRPRYPEVGDSLLVSNLTDQAAKVERAIRPQAVALGLFAVLAGLITLAVGGQMLSRQVALDAAEYPILRAMGMDRRQLVALSMLRVGAAAVLGATIATALSVAASPLMPIGPARLAEPHPGWSVNLAIAGLGFLAAAVLPLAVVAPAAWRAATGARGVLGVAEPSSGDSPSRLAAAMAGVGRPLSATVGVRMALEPGHGRSAVPVRSAVVGTTLALAAVVTSLVFGTNMIRLVDTPVRYGQGWDAAVDGAFFSIPAHAVVAALSSHPGVVGYAAGNYGELNVGGRQVAAVGIDRLRGDVFPTLLQGRPPVGPDEIVLGTLTLRRLDRSVGQTTPVRFGATERTMRIVGRAVFPNLGRGQFTPTGLGEGAAVTASLIPSDAGGGPPPSEPGYNFFLVRFRPGTDPAAARAFLFGVVQAAGCPVGQSSCVTDRQRPTDIANYARVRATPLVLGACLGALAMATLGHVLVTAIHRRRRDLAVLKALGFTPRQVSATVMWQSMALAAVALAFGLPLGVAVGRVIWGSFASSLGVATSARVPLSVLAAIPLTLIVANLLAAGPGWLAGRVRPATVLRTE